MKPFFFISLFFFFIQAIFAQTPCNRGLKKIYFTNQNKNTVKIPTNQPTNSLYKAGWELIFNDDFEENAIPSYWNKSNLNDDGNGQCDGMRMMADPNLVYTKNGICHFPIIEHPDQTTCNYSICELKTFSVTDNSFLWWEIQPNSYVEIRAQLPIEKGVGSAFWLYSTKELYSEIDLWETGGTYPDRFQSNFIFQTEKKGKVFGTPYMTLLTDMNGKKLDIRKEWLTFGVALFDNEIDLYVNGVLTRKIALADCPLCLFEHWVGGDCPPQHPQLQPYHLRINSSRGLDHAKFFPKGADLPQELKVDYVRIYKKTNSKAITVGSSYFENNVWTASKIMPENANRTLYLGGTFYPNVRYEWKSKDFAIQNPNERVATIQMPAQKLPKGTYPIYFTATYPSGVVEKDSLLITVE